MSEHRPNTPMQIIRGSLHFKKLAIKNPVVTLGNFDGVHRGHQKILKKTIERAQAIGGSSLVYTFDPHPLNVLRPEAEPLKITTFAEKAQLISAIGIDYLVCERFTKRFSEKTAEAFIEEIINGRLRPREIVIGHDYAFGRNRDGSVQLLQKMGAAYGYEVHVISDITIKNIPVRSTTIRSLIADGKVSLASKLLGSFYSLSGKVIHGRQRRIGFPTANLSQIKDLVPQNGVYAIRAATPYGCSDGVVSIGCNPTFDGTRLCIEAHLFDFDHDLYGKNMTIFFIKRIRGERKFAEVPALVGQIEKDIAFAKKVLKKA